MNNSVEIENNGLFRGRSREAASNCSNRLETNVLSRDNSSKILGITRIERSVATYVVRRLVELNQVGLCSSRFTDKRSHTWKVNSKSKTRFSRSSFIELPSSSRVGNSLLKIKDWSGPKF